MYHVEYSVSKNRNKNSLHVFTINLDANADRYGILSLSIVARVVLTILVLVAIKYLKDCPALPVLYQILQKTQKH